jgi:hypothetical protein
MRVDASVAANLDHASVVQQLLERHGEEQRARIATGVRQVAERWTEADGDQAAFAALCQTYFVADPGERERLLARLERLLVGLRGHLHELHRTLRRWSDLRGDEFPGVDDLLATFNPAPDLTEQLYRQKLAWVALLNFERPTLATMLRHGAEWSLGEWAAARVALAFGARIPAEVNLLAHELGHRADTFVNEFHVPVGRMVDADGRAWFEPGRKLIAHWLIREEIKAGYNEPGGLAKQRALMWVMRRHIDGTIPRVVMDGSSESPWDPQANTLAGAPAGAVIGTERYARWLDQLTVARAFDPYYPDYPTAIARRFELQREIPEEEVERLIHELLGSPVRAELAAFVRRRLGRDLEAHDIYFDEVAQARPPTELNERVSARFADEGELEQRLPEVLRELGFAPADADFFGQRIRVEIAKGPGHAYGPGLPEYGAWLRTNRLDDQLGWDGFDTAMHELGHNLEQLASTHLTPRPALQDVPNTACSEAFAFLYQSLGKQVIGLARQPDEPDPFEVDTLQTVLAACQIAGPSLVDLYAWRWLYQNPEATPEALRDEVLRLADELWARYYAAWYGPDPYHILAAYQHMIGYPLYLADYTLGHLISHQIRSHVRGRNLAEETKRICGIGRLTPDLWMHRAVGSGISPATLLADAAAALDRLDRPSS